MTSSCCSEACMCMIHSDTLDHFPLQFQWHSQLIGRLYCIPWTWLLPDASASISPEAIVNTHVCLVHRCSCGFHVSKKAALRYMTGNTCLVFKEADLLLEEEEEEEEEIHYVHTASKGL